MRLERERRARGGTVADVLRDNLDLAFAVKAELAKIVEGEYDENDPKNAPRLVHTLLFRVEERILGALDTLSRKLGKEFSHSDAIEVNRATEDSPSNGPALPTQENYMAEVVDGFINLLARDSEHSPEVWIGAFLEIVGRLQLVSGEQLDELKHRGEIWLEEHGYYSSAEESDGIEELVEEAVG